MANIDVTDIILSDTDQLIYAWGSATATYEVVVEWIPRDMSGRAVEECSWAEKEMSKILRCLDSCEIL